MDWFWAALAAVSGFLALFIPFLLEHLKGRRERNSADYEIEYDNWIAQKAMSYDVLLRRLIGLDYVSTPNLDEKSEGKVEQWAPVFRKSPDTWGLVVFRDEPIVGYWSFFSLSDRLLERLRSGRLHDSEITANEIHSLEEDREHHLHVVMIARQPEYVSGRKQIFSKLIQSLCSAIADLETRGVRVARIYANAFTPEGHELCERLGFVEVVPAEQGGMVYETVLTDALKARLSKLSGRVPAPRRRWSFSRWLRNCAPTLRRSAQPA